MQTTKDPYEKLVFTNAPGQGKITELDFDNKALRNAVDNGWAMVDLAPNDAIVKKVSATDPQLGRAAANNDRKRNALIQVLQNYQ